MRKLDQYLTTIDTIYPDGYARETIFRDNGDMLEPATVGPAPRNLLARLFAALHLWEMKRSSRLALRELSDSQLEDIGITRAEARSEAGKSLFLPR